MDGQQVIYLPRTRSTLGEGVSAGSQMLVQAIMYAREQIEREKQEKLAEEDRKRRLAQEDLKQQLGIAELERQAAAETNRAEAPGVQPTALSEESGAVTPEEADYMKGTTPQRRLEITLPGGKKILPLAPLRYKDEIAEEEKKQKAEAAAEALKQLGLKTRLEEGIKAEFRPDPRQDYKEWVIDGKRTAATDAEVAAAKAAGKTVTAWHPATGTGGAGGGGAHIAGDFALTGEAFLKTLPEEYRNVVRNIALNKITLEKATAQRKGGKDAASERLQFAAWASQYDDSYDQTQAAGRVTAQQDLSRDTPASHGGKITSLNRLGRHIAEAEKINEDMQKEGLSTHGVQALNALGLKITPKGSQVSAGRWKTAAGSIVTEYNKLLKGGVPTNEELRLIIDEIQDPSLPPANRKANLEVIKAFAEAQADAQEDWFTSTFGKPSVEHPLKRDNGGLLTPASGWVWDPSNGWTMTGKVGKDAAAPSPAAPAAPAAGSSASPAGPALPAIGEVKRGYRFKGGDPSKPESWEKVQ